MLNMRLIPPLAVVLALAAPGAAIGKPGSDAGGSASDESTGAAATQDLRSPDVRDAASGAVQSTSGQDLRSPDVRDAASGNVQPADPVPAVQTVTRDDGFEWGSAGVGAAAMLAIVLAFAAAAALLVPRRRMRSPISH